MTHAPPGEKAMLAFSGGPSSRCAYLVPPHDTYSTVHPFPDYWYTCLRTRAMLQLLYDYHEVIPHGVAKERLFSSIEICHVDESVILDSQVS
jgi:hypothetical protein